MELLPLLDAQSAEPLYSQLYRHMRGEIEAGRLSPGSRLPSVRKLAAHLGISRTPVENAYQQLLAEGYAESKPRSGITVGAYEPDFGKAEAKSEWHSGKREEHDKADELFGKARDRSPRAGNPPNAAKDEARQAAEPLRTAKNHTGQAEEPLPAMKDLTSQAGEPLRTTKDATRRAMESMSSTKSEISRDGESMSLTKNEIGRAGEHQSETKHRQGEPTPTTIDFSYGDVDLSHFPFPLWKKLLGFCFLPEHRDLFRYGDPLGESGFREALSDYAYRARAVVCPPERIVVGAGTHHTMEQICRLLQDTPYSSRHTAIAVEPSMSDGIAAIMRQHGYALVPLALEPDGICIEDLYASGAKLVYVTPSHQFPHGIVMSIGKRRRLLNWAAEVDGVIVEDDYDGEFRYAGLPIPSLQGLNAAASRVVYMGTFSRALAPAFRLSYTALPPALAAAARAALHPFDRLASPLHQKTLELFMTGGHMQRHIRKMRSVYQRKMAALLNAVKQRLEPRFLASGGAAGLHVLLYPADGEGSDEGRLIRLAHKAGVRVYPTSVYRIVPPSLGDENAATIRRAENSADRPVAPCAVLLGFGGLDERQIKEGVDRLADAWR